MRAISLPVADVIHTYSSQCVLKCHSARYAELRSFSVGLAKFEQSLGEDAADEYWRLFLRPMRRYRFELCAAPMSATEIASRSQNLVASLRHHIRRCEMIYSIRDATIARALLDQMVAVARTGTSPLLDVVIKVCKGKPTGDRAMLLKDMRLASLVETALADHRKLSEVKVVSTAQVRGGTCYGQLVVVGPLRWFPEDVFSSPRASRIDVITYDWIRDRWEPEKTFVSPIASARRRKANIRLAPEISISSEEDSWTDPESLLPMFNLSEIFAKLDSSTDDGTVQECVEAHGYYLAGDMAVFLETDETASVLVIDPQEDDRHRVERMLARDIEPGCYVLLRTAGGGDYIVPLADRIMGEKTAHARECQRHWKEKLQAFVRSHGVAETSRQLLQCGSKVANEQNVRNWVSSRSIRTQDKRDFMAIMRLTGLEKDAEHRWTEMERIDRAHKRAGREIRKLLLKQVANTSLEELERIGRMDFALPDADAGSLTAFRVEGIAAEVCMISVRHIGHPLPIEG